MKCSSICLASAFLTVVASTSLAQTTPMSEADCTAWMAKVDVNGDGTLDATEGKPFQEKLTSSNMKTATPDTMTKDEFMQMCTAGNFSGVPM
jgi:hypothetical protein